MTDGATDDDSGGGRLELGPAADELFADLETESPDDRSGRETGDGGDVEDRTAADVFGQLQADADEAGDDETGADDLLDGETPEDIIASADDPDPEPEIDDDLLADEGELEALLLTDRVEGEEFLWIDTGDADDEPDEGDAGGDGDAETDASDDASTSDDADASDGLVLTSVDDLDEETDAGEVDGEEAEDDDDERDDADGSDESSGVVGRFRSKLPF